MSTPPNFLANYLTFTRGNEAHELYHLWSGLVALSSIVSYRIWVPMGYFQVRANLYVILDGPPGDRKTTAMQQCKNLLKEVGDIPFSADCQTKESLVRRPYNTHQSRFALLSCPSSWAPRTPT